MSESNHHDNYISDQSSEAESFESLKSLKISMNEKLDKMEKDVSDKFDKIMEMFAAIKLIDTEVVARKHDVSSLDNDKSIDEDDYINDTSSNEATNFIGKPHFSSHGALTQIEKIDRNSTDENFIHSRKRNKRMNSKHDFGYDIDLSNEKDKEIVEAIIKTECDQLDHRALKNALDDINKQFVVSNIIELLRKKQNNGSLRRFDNYVDASIESFKNDENPFNLPLFSGFIAFDHTKLDQIIPQWKKTDNFSAAQWFTEVANILKQNALNVIIFETPILRLNSIIRNHKWICSITHIFSNMKRIMHDTKSQDFKSLVETFIKENKLKEIGIIDANQRLKNNFIYYELPIEETQKRINNIINTFIILGKDQDINYVYENRHLFLDMKVMLLLSCPLRNMTINSMFRSLVEYITYSKQYNKLSVNNALLGAKSDYNNSYEYNNKENNNELFKRLNKSLKDSNYHDYKDAYHRAKKEIKKLPLYDYLDNSCKNKLNNLMASKLKKNSKGIYSLKYSSENFQKQNQNDHTDSDSSSDNDISISESFTISIIT